MPEWLRLVVQAFGAIVLLTLLFATLKDALFGIDDDSE